MRAFLASLIGAQIVFWVGGLILRPGKQTDRAKRKAHPNHREAITFLRPIKSGVLNLEATLQRFLLVAAPGDQILFGLTSNQKEEIRICQNLVRSGIEVETIICESSTLPNPKVSKLAQMEKHAINKIHLLLDAEAEVNEALLAALLAKLTQKTVVTAFYGFSAAHTLAQIADCLNSACFLWTGTVWTRRFNRQKFVFGACVLYNQEHLQKIGGWQVLGDFLGEDFHLGKQLSSHRISIALADLPISLTSDRQNWKTYFEHQLRVALTYRVTNPLGYFGSVLVQGVPLMLLAFFFKPKGGIALSYSLILFRGLIHQRILHHLDVRVPLWKTLLVTPLCLATETATWLCSWFLSTVKWGDWHYRVTRKGTLNDLGVRS